MRITTNVLKLARNNNASLECINWLIDNIDNQITRENIIPEYYIWLTSIGFPPNLNLINFCITKVPENVMKHVSYLLNDDQIEYCIKINPKGAIKYLDHRMSPSDINTCNLLSQDKSVLSKKHIYLKNVPSNQNYYNQI